MRKIVISDIHGSFYTMKKLLEEVKFNPSEDKLICLGDMCDRGKNTKLVWEYFYNLQKNYSGHVVLLGNHEDMFNLAMKEALYNEYDNRRQNHYFRNGGLTTLKSFYPDATEETRRYYFKKMAKEYKEIRMWVKKLQTRYESQDFYFVHAGVDFEKNFWNQTHRDMIWIREPYLSSTKKYSKKIFHGHTPVKEVPHYDIKENRINIDGGCVYDGKLNIVVIDGDSNIEIKQSRILEKDIYKELEEKR
ncbi:metallophosphoesterase family protein [Gemella cuniculi]|uniref:metallophosphoesterase family protein n=1 Tax=Gemella cuniculi TaxID=150240 RepID=UPI00042A579D|nr:metallophosphoesterase family protein [Gemella cuniculi]